MSSSPAGGSRFADYFVIAGLDLASGLEPDQLSGDNLHCLPLDRPYKSKVLAHFPENVPWNPFDKDAVGMLCLPKGLTFRTLKQKRQPSFHTFIITREDGSRTYGSAYLFYEEVVNQQICAAMKTLHSMHLAELSNDQSRTLYSHLGSVYDPSTPRPQRKQHLQNPDNLYDMEKDHLFVTKCICLLTPLPFVAACKKYLTLLHMAIASREPPTLPLESYVYNVLYEVPLMPPGRSLRFHCLDREIVCQRPGINELPLFDFPLKEMFELLGVENVLLVFTSILVENQILLYSNDYQRLMLVAEGMTTLMFPFMWQHVYVPILPASLIHFLDAPVPFIMGLHRGNENRSQLQLPGEANMCFVDIDAGTVDAPEDLPQFPQRQELTEEIKSILAQFGVMDRKEKDAKEKERRERRRAASRSRSRSHSKTRQGKGSFENDSGMSSNDESVSSPLMAANIPGKYNSLEKNDTLAKIMAIARRTGVLGDTEDIHDVLSDRRKKKDKKKPEDEIESEDNHLKDLKFNNAVREVFLNRFLHIFSSYEAFIILPSQELGPEEWLTNRESMQNYDKAAFLSDQPDTFLPFLCRFIETQMFTTLIDNKILAIWEDCDYNLRVYEARLKLLKEKYGEARTPTCCDASVYQETEAIIEKRGIHIDHSSPIPHSLDDVQPRPHHCGYFPDLDAVALNKQPIVQSKPKKDSAKWRRKDRYLQHSEHLQLNSDQREKYIQEARAKMVRQPRLSELAQTGMMATNWKFVETLLKEAKGKTKRMLVEKMGQEAVDLGHGDQVTLTGVEENTLIASLCDLLERIWSHGLQTKQGKSALWSHLLNFQEIEECNDNSKPIDPNFLTPDISTLALDGDGSRSGTPEATPPGTPKKHKRKNSRGPELPTLIPLRESVTFDMKNILKMKDIKTDVGYARAWVRLALEKKLLSRHLKELLSDTDLLRSSYKRYAFLRCEDEREQFLCHLLSLNAVDYFCFTNTFTSTIIPYRVLIFPSRKFQGYATSANPYICLAGNLGDTGVVQVARHTLEILVEHKNLGMLTTLRIGHDNSGITPKWMIEHVLVRNDITGHTYKFPCGRWLGKGIDDGSIERLLVGELVPLTTDGEDLCYACSTPPRTRSPILPRKAPETKVRLPEIQQMLGESVNNLVKHYYKPEKERGSLTYLLCGEGGLVECLDNVFQYGYKSARLFRNRLYAWDYIEKCQAYFASALKEDVKVSQMKRAAYMSYCNVVARINEASQSVGKDGKFQLFVCVGLRDHVLERWLPVMAEAPVTASMYEENSFMREPTLLNFVVHLIHSLRDFTITLEASLVKGLDV
ncbi:DENN domain-containing protein 5B isoform X2 [Lingula anatina]|uniref:DENN domain-containing protein 5B isoform X2 n=1 Tax=Lingula anatina TaxID=7574 RepID=A0A1S3H3Q3_LINAN|nr:DENN domain-containing protein 5B isoform X2 [Lingula anatina]|eukprot:XP_013380096.1 DENN domain-containing protein 5B isoform X2 [Lingula anatina]